MDPRNDEPFDPAPWRTLLGADSGAPPRDVNRRVLAESRRALAPRVTRWWLPASLAASLLLAVLLVQRQLAVAPAPVSESEVAMSPAPARTDAAQNQSEPAAATAVMAPAPARDEPALERGQASDLKSTIEAPAVMPMQLPPSAMTQEDSSRSAEGLHAKSAYTMTPRLPEEWYAEIEKLRGEGRVREADEELARFKAANPGWLERHDKKDP